MAKTNIKIRIADWDKDQTDLKKIRQLVFIMEQHVPEELEWDGDDNTSTHFIVTINNKAIASARLKPDGQIGRMAVLTQYRNQGTGSKLLAYIIQTATSQSIKQLYLHAQVSAIPFYEKHGFSAFGNIFYEADIPHREMSLTMSRE